MIYPEISIVMPAFNAEKFIKEAIESILNQTFENFELIIADDCSTDNTVKIIESFNDERIKLIKTDKNSGSAKYPRELAIENASSNLICWIDADDTIDRDYLAQLLKRKRETSSNVVCSQMVAEENGSVKYFLPRKKFDFHQIVSGKDAFRMTLEFPWEINLNGWLCDKMTWINISTFKNQKIIHMNADDYSAREILFNSKKVAFSPAVYHYRLTSTSITKKISIKRFESVITDRLVFNFINKEWNDDNKPLVLKTFHKTLCQNMINLIRMYVINQGLFTESENNKIKKLLKDNFNQISYYMILKNNLILKYKLLLMFPFNLSLILINKINKK